MQLSSGSHIPDGLLAAIALRNENSRLGVPSKNPALHQGIDASNSTIVLGLQSTAALNRVGSRCTGKERDGESGNDYFGARYYASSMGRFMSPDYSDAPVAVPFATLSNPQTLNLYSYVGNNPLSITDPFGHNWFTDFLNGLANATYRPLVTAIEHPIITGRAVGNAVAHPIATARAIRTGVVTTSQQVMTGNGTAIGTALGTAGMLFVPGVGEAGDAAEAVEGVAEAGQAAEAATDAAAAGASAPIDTSGLGNIGGGSTTAENALTQADKYLGPGAKEIAPGVFRSADGTRQFRMTTGDITGAHGNIGPHVHFESIGADGRTITENSHVGITNP
jgi:RHS repeat-associated protein